MPAQIEDVIRETPTIRTFVLHLGEPMPFRAGQFVQLYVPGVGEAPFTPSSSPSEAQRIEVTVLVAGRVTAALNALQPGDRVGVRGPFGRGYPLQRLEGREVVVVGGGVGLAPLRSLLYTLFERPELVRRVSIRYGARGPEELCFRGQYADWAARGAVDLVQTIDRPAAGWTGRVGLVTTLLDGLDVDLRTACAVCCGPEIMLKFVARKLVDVGFGPERIILSMNRNMTCGMGICGRCNVGSLYLCKDGPDLSYAEIQHVPYALG
jgi:NAD(P)H-flavin reductase